MELTEARRLAAGLVSFKKSEDVLLEEGLGRVLAKTLRAERDLPGESRSGLDGFALRSSDTLSAASGKPVDLKILAGLLAAGHTPAPKLQVLPGECIRILTGAPVPYGADAVVAQEDVFFDNTHVSLERGLGAGSGVVPLGRDIRAGETVLFRGDVLSPSRLALAAAFGIERLPVYERPRVALLATGDELREPGQGLDGPFSFCNNRYLLGWLTRLCGGVALHLGIAPDDSEAICQKLSQTDCDFFITTGGIGRGDRDLVLEAWSRLSVQTLFRHIDLAPGKNSALGRRGEKVFCALPGNPWGAQVVFEQIVAPMLRRCQGLDPERFPFLWARLEKPLKKKKGIARVVRGILNLEVFPPSFSPLAGEEGSLFAALRNNFAYTLLESHVVEVAAGSAVQVRLNDFPLPAAPVLGLF